MSLAYRQDALALIAGALAERIAPPEHVAPSQWAAENLIVGDGPRKLGRWDLSLTPYIVEPLDLCSTESPVNEFCVMKSAQTGFTTLLLAAVGHTIARDRADTMIVQPTDGALTKFNTQKLQPTIDLTPALAALVAKQTSRSGEGSTTYEKRFGRYFLTLALASSSADLRSKTVQKVFLDEVDEYPEDLDGQGSPFDMVAARQTTFLKEGTWKRVMISTPTVAGSSAIERAFEESDKRRWHVKCPHCGEQFVFEWGANFCFDDAAPFNAHYVCRGCGVLLREHERFLMVRGGRWIATAPGPGKKRGYHFDELSSPFVPWDDIAEKFTRAQRRGDLKGFYTLTLGLPYQFKGDAPDHVRLMERRESGLKRGQIPPKGVLLVAGADVQMRGIWVEVVAFAPDRQTWTVEAIYCEGATESPDGEAFQALEKQVLDREWPDFWGRTRKIDGLAIDSGYQSHAVYAWTRKRQRLHPSTGADVIHAVKGIDQWGVPAFGTPQIVDIDLAGGKVRKGAKKWSVGTWPIKGAFYEDLNKEGTASGKPVDPPGHCHFGTWLDEAYFRQLTAEYLASEKIRGRIRHFWRMKPGFRDNHFLDCRVYAIAMADHLGLHRFTDDEWKALIKERCAADSDALALFAAPAGQASPAAAPPPDEEDDAAALARLGKMNSERFR